MTLGVPGGAAAACSLTSRQPFLFGLDRDPGPRGVIAHSRGRMIAGPPFLPPLRRASTDVRYGRLTPQAFCALHGY